MPRTGEAPVHSHDLLELFDGLSEEARTWLERRFPAEPDPFDTHRFSPIGSGMRKTLEFHRRAFEHRHPPMEKCPGKR